MASLIRTPRPRLHKEDEAFAAHHNLANVSRKQFDARVICQDNMAESADPEAFHERLWQVFLYHFRMLFMLPQAHGVR